MAAKKVAKKSASKKRAAKNSDTPKGVKTNKQHQVDTVSGVSLKAFMNVALTQLKIIPGKWKDLDEQSQQDILDEMESGFREQISRAVVILNNMEHVSADADFKNVKKGEKEITASLSFGLHEKRGAELFAHGNRRVTVVLKTGDEIDGDDLPKADPDQPPLGIE